MSWFQLDAESVVARAQASGRPVEIPCVWTSVQRGIVGFTILSLAGFAPWAFRGKWFCSHIGEGGLYAVCALVYIGLSGPLLHRLILGPASLPRFYKLFGLVFAANSVLWIAGWMALNKVNGHLGSVAGLLAGTVAMGWLLARAFDAKEAALKVIATLFILNAIGYFVGGWMKGAVLGMKQVSFFGYVMSAPAQGIFGRSLWGVGYGVGLGAGLGLAFHFCQSRTRAALENLKTAAISKS